jgi:hypothetical protein
VLAHPRTGFSIGQHCYKIRLKKSPAKVRAAAARIMDHLRSGRNRNGISAVDHDKSEQKNILINALLNYFSCCLRMANCIPTYS